MKYFGTMTDDNDLVNKKYVDDKSIDIENEISDIIANEYSSSSTYASGSYVIHEGGLYRCTTAITTPEVWNSAHWTEVTVGGEFVNNRNTHNILQNLITANTQLIAGELENTANFYNPANTYNVGDYVLQSVTTQSGTKDRLFRCTTQISTPEAWNSSHWTVVNLAGEIKSNKSNIQDISNDVDELYDYTKELDRTRYGEILQFRDSKTILGLTWEWDNTDFSITGRATDSDAYYYLFNHVSFPELAIMERKMAFTGSATTPVDIASTCYLIIRFYARGSEISNASYRLNDGYVDQQITVPSNAEEFSMYLWVQQDLSTDINYTGTLKLYGSYTGEMIGETFNRIGEQLNETNDELSNVKSAINKTLGSIVKGGMVAGINESDPVWTIADNKYVNSTNGALVDGSATQHHYKTYYAQFTDAYSMWVDSYGSGNYCSIAIYNGELSTSNFTAIYRKSDNNLPTQNNQLSVGANRTIAVSIRNDFEFVLKGSNPEWEMLGGILSSNIEVPAENVMPPLYYKYDSTAGTNYTESISVLVPAAVGFTKYLLLHSYDTSIKCDVWRVDKAVAVDANKADRFDLTTAGEWECAVRLAGRPDFSGGIAHGDEVYTSVTFLVDGLVKATSAMPTSYTPIDRLTVLQASTLYDPSDETRAIATNTSMHIFSAEGLKIRQTVKWSVAETVENCFLAMLPMAKALSNYVVSDQNFEPRSLATLPVNYAYPVSKSTLYGASNGITVHFDVPVYPALSTIPTNRLRVIDNGSTQYNKVYYYVTATADAYTTRVNELWQSETVYNFEIGK